MKAQSSPLPTSAEDVELSKFDEVQYIEQVEIRVRAVRASSRAWLETLKLSNVKLRKSGIDKPRFTIISTNLRDCVSQTIQVSVVATKIVATRSCLNIYQNILFTI